MANLVNCESIKTEIAMFCYCIVEPRSVGCKCLTVQNCRTSPWRYAFFFPFGKPAGRGSACSLTISTEEGCGSNMAAARICSDQSLYVYSCERERERCTESLLNETKRFTCRSWLSRKKRRAHLFSCVTTCK